MLLSLLKKLNLSGFVYPSFCRSCNVLTDEESLCEHCASLIMPLASVRLPITKTKSLVVYCVGNYTTPLREMILGKLSGDRSASYALGSLLLERTPVRALGVDLLVPVPLHWRRYATRGFNQAQVMAHVVGSALDIPVVPLLKRVRATQFQSQMPFAERAQNVHSVFALTQSLDLSRELVRGKHVCIVDDLCTTGATLTNVARALLPLNPASISAVVVSVLK